MPGQMTHSVKSSTLADVLERILDKGLVIAGDIKIKLVDIELLTIQIRLMIASVDKAREMGMDWWVDNPFLSASSRQRNAALVPITTDPATLPAPAPVPATVPASLPAASLAPADTAAIAQEVAQLETRLRELQARLLAAQPSSTVGPG